ARRGRRVLVPLLGHCWSVVLLVIANTEWRVASSKFKNALFAIRYSLLSKHTEMLRHNGVVELDLIGGAAKYDATGVDDDDVVGEVEGELDVLLDQHDRLAFGLELRDGAADLGHQLRRASLGGFGHPRLAGIAKERAANRQHLLLAAGGRPGELGLALGQAREELEAAIDRPAGAAVFARLRRHHQIFAHGQRAEHAPPLR